MTRAEGRAALEDRLGPDLARLVTGLDSPVVDAALITGLPSARLSRATFRLTCADGRIMKGRRLDQPGDAERIHRLSEALRLPFLPRVRARHGVALLEDWVPGAPLAASQATAGLLRRCGAMLGTIHTVPLPAGSDRGLEATAARRVRLGRRLERLARLTAVPPGLAGRLAELAGASVPEWAQVGFIHRDLCPENIVIRAPDDPWVVDNGTLGVDACDFDLARTWYRWPMSRAGRRAFADGYREHRSDAAFRRRFAFWAIDVLVEATLFRHEAATPDAAVPLARLARLVRDLDHGLTWDG